MAVALVQPAGRRAPGTALDINQSLLFQAAWPIETQDKTRQTGIDRQQ